MVSGKQDFTKSYVPVRAFGRGFRCANESLQKVFRETLPASGAIFMQPEVL
jgi:uncharacterized protein (DUF1684 family)